MANVSNFHDSEGHLLRIHLDEETDAIYLELSDGYVEQTIKFAMGLIADFDETRELIGLEILDQHLLLEAIRAGSGEITIPDRLDADGEFHLAGND
jgi:uncharacterized protein YuzE